MTYHIYPKKKKRDFPLTNLQSEEAAIKALSLKIANSGKDINEELLQPMTVPFPMLQRILYFTRSGYFIYDDGHDCFTHSSTMKHQAALLPRDPLKL